MKSKILFLVLFLICAIVGSYYSTNVFFVAKIEKAALSDADSTLSISEKLAKYSSNKRLLGKTYYECKERDSAGLSAGDLTIRYKLHPSPKGFYDTKSTDSLSKKVHKTNYLLRSRLLCYQDIDYIPLPELDKDIYSLHLNNVVDDVAIRKLFSMIGNFSFFEVVDHARNKDYFLKVKSRIEQLTSQSTKLPNKKSHTAAYLISKDQRKIVDSLIQDRTNPLELSLPDRLIYGIDSTVIDGKDCYPLYLCQGIDDNGHGFSIGEYVITVTVQRSKINGYSQLMMDTYGEGAKRWEQFTNNNTKLTVAAVIDNRVYMAPFVNSAISGGICMLSSSIDYSEAKVLAAVIQNRQLPLSVEVVSSEYVPATIDFSNLNGRYALSLTGMILSGLALIASLIGLYLSCAAFLRSEKIEYEKMNPEALPRSQAMYWLLLALHLLALTILCVFSFFSVQTNTWALNIGMILFIMTFSIGLVLFWLRERSGWYLSVVLFFLLGVGCCYYLSTVFEGNMMRWTQTISTIAYLYLWILYVVHILILLFNKHILALFGLGSVTLKDNSDTEKMPQRAPVLSRFAGYAIDYVVILGLLYLVAKLFDINIVHKSHVWIPFTVNYLYYLILEYTFGRTAGKWILSMKTVSHSREKKPSFNDIMIRSFMRLVPLDPISYIIGWRWHDNVSGTTVVKSRDLN